MLENIRIGNRIAAGIVGVVLLAVAIIIPLMLDRIGAIVATAERKELQGYFNNIQAAIAAEGSAGELSEPAGGGDPRRTGGARARRSAAAF